MFFDESSNLTEAEWLAGEDPYPMIAYLRLGMNDRKCRLFFCAACRRLLPFTPNPAARAYVEAQEAFADGRLGVDDLVAAQQRLWPQRSPGPVSEGEFMARRADNTIGHLDRLLHGRVFEEIISALVMARDPD